MSGKSAASKISIYQEKMHACLKMKQTINSNHEKTKKIDISKTQLKKHLIKKFKKHSHEKKGKLNNFSKVLEKSTQSISDEKNFTCPICLQILISPVIFQCGHFACLKCIETVTVYQNKCFLCRKVFENLQYKPSQIISSIISKNIIKSIDNPIDYYTRLADYLEWPKKKKLTIGQIEIGKLVDVRCGQSGKWKSGIVVSVKNPENSKYILLIKYKHQGLLIQELIDINSSRLAKRGFYTQKKALEACNQIPLEVQMDIPQISIENFENSLMDRNIFFVNRKEQNYFSDIFAMREDFSSEQKVLTPEVANEREAFDYFERDLDEFLNPQLNNNFLQPELLQVYQ